MKNNFWTYIPKNGHCAQVEGRLKWKSSLTIPWRHRRPKFEKDHHCPHTLPHPKPRNSICFAICRKIFNHGTAKLYTVLCAKGGFFSERADAFVVSSNRQTYLNAQKRH